MQQLSITDIVQRNEALFSCSASTGSFCIAGCGHQQHGGNTSYSLVECLEQGYRPCPHCRPLLAGSEASGMLADALMLLQNQPRVAWSVQKLRDKGLDPDALRLDCKRQYGVTFLNLASLVRIAHTHTVDADRALAQKEIRVAGYASDKHLVEELSSMFSRAVKRDTTAELVAGLIETELGQMLVVADAQALHLLEFIERRALRSSLQVMEKRFPGVLCVGKNRPMVQIEMQLAKYYRGDDAEFTVPLVEHGSDYTRNVWRELQNIPAGQTSTYSALAKRLGGAQSARAVARANGANQLSIVIPCHRLLSSTGALTGYGGGLWRKQRLLELEKRCYA